MRNFKLLAFALSGVLAVSAMGGITAGAEGEAATDVVASEETTQAVKSIIVAEVTVSDEWTGGDFTKTIDLSGFGKDFGGFTALMLNDTAVDGSCYTVSQNGNESVTFTINEAFMSTLTAETNYFTVDFEKVTIQPAFAVTATEAEEDTTAASEEQPTEAAPAVGAPKTGDKGTASLFALLAVSGLTAAVLRKKK